MKRIATLLSVAATILLSNCADVPYSNNYYDDDYNRALYDNGYNRFACRAYDHDFRFCR
jgi:hypothetical protein